MLPICFEKRQMLTLAGLAAVQVAGSGGRHVGGNVISRVIITVVKCLQLSQFDRASTRRHPAATAEYCAEWKMKKLPVFITSLLVRAVSFKSKPHVGKRAHKNPSVVFDVLVHVNMIKVRVCS